MRHSSLPRVSSLCPRVLMLLFPASLGFVLLLFCTSVFTSCCSSVLRPGELITRIWATMGCPLCRSQPWALLLLVKSHPPFPPRKQAIHSQFCGSGRKKSGHLLCKCMSRGLQARHLEPHDGDDVIGIPTPSSA